VSKTRLLLSTQSYQAIKVRKIPSLAQWSAEKAGGRRDPSMTTNWTPRTPTNWELYLCFFYFPRIKAPDFISRYG
jgi:hypothetical protein